MPDLSTLLRVGPVVASSLTVMYSHDQYFFLNIWFHPQIGLDTSNKILPKWFDVFFRKGLNIIGGLNTLTISTALGALLRSDGLSQDSPARQWYWLGFGFTVAHFLFVPLIMYPIRDIVEDRSEGKSTEDLKKWLKVHLIRCLLVDLPAWTCFITGFGMLLKS